MEAFSKKQINKAFKNRLVRIESKDIYNTYKPDLKSIAEKKGKEGILFTIKCFLSDLKTESDYFKRNRIKKRIINLNKCFLTLN